MAEQRAHNPTVAGSSPALGTRDLGAVGSAAACRAEGHGFEPRRSRCDVAQRSERPGCDPGASGCRSRTSPRRAEVVGSLPAPQAGRTGSSPVPGTEVLIPESSPGCTPAMGCGSSRRAASSAGAGAPGPRGCHKLKWTSTGLQNRGFQVRGLGGARGRVWSRPGVEPHVGSPGHPGSTPGASTARPRRTMGREGRPVRRSWPHCSRWVAGIPSAF